MPDTLQALAFASILSRHYTARSFETPATPAAAATPPAAWTCYLLAEGGGDGDPPVRFADFMQTDAFVQVREQICDRIDDCRSFATAHLSEADARVVRDGLDRFLQHLTVDDGQDFFSLEQLQLLYSFGKRCLDDFCLLLNHPEIELHQRKIAVRELAQQIPLCRGAGPAFMEALQALQQPAGTLQGLYAQALREAFDQTILQVVRHRADDPDSEWQLSMEVHIVNRVRLDLGLPGADPRDAFSLGTIASRALVMACARCLMHECTPSTMALTLAGQYRARLLQETMSELRGDEAPPGIDPDDPRHMDALLRAHQRLSGTFTGVSLNSVLAEDVDSGQFQWRGDDALIARELLAELGRLGFIRELPPMTLVQGTGDGGPWRLCLVPPRLFFVEERVPGPGGGAVEVSGMALPHLAALMKRRGLPKWLYRNAAAAVLQGAPDASLAAFPVRWLSEVTQCRTLLRRLTPGRSMAWAQSQTLDSRVLSGLLPASIAENHGELLLHLLTLVTAHPVAEAREALRLMLSEYARRLPSDALLQGSLATWQGVLALVAAVAETHDRPGGLVARLLDLPMQEAMRRVPLEKLCLLGDFWRRAARSGWLPPGVMPGLMDGHGGGAGCRSAGMGRRLEVMRWFHGVIGDLAEQGALTRHQATDLMYGAAAHPQSLAQVLLRDSEPAALACHLQAVIELARRGWMAADALPHLLRLPGRQEMTNLLLLFQHGHPGMARAWTSAVIQACQHKLMTGTDVLDLLNGPALLCHSLPERQRFRPMPRLTVTSLILAWQEDILLPVGRRLEHWRNTLGELSDAGLLTREQLLEVLENREQGRPLLALLQPPREPETIAEVANLYVDVHLRGLISQAQLVGLLTGPVVDGDMLVHPDPGGESTRLIFACLAARVNNGHLSADIRGRVLQAVALHHFRRQDDRDAFIERMVHGLPAAAVAAADGTDDAQTATDGS